MRRPDWREAGERDWGLPAPGRWDDAHEGVARTWRALAGTVLAAVDGRRLRRRVAGVKGPVLVSFGTGTTPLDGWICTDLVRNAPDVLMCDMRRPLPFSSHSIDGVLVEHALEHLDLDDVLRFVAECARVVRPGGRLRIVAPDAEIVARLLMGDVDSRVQAVIDNDHEVHRWPRTQLGRARVANRLSHQWGAHRSLLSYEILEQILARSGFGGILRSAPDETHYFDHVPGTHLARFPASGAEAFALEAVRLHNVTGGRAR
jgi:predicted SAM-dependent methyltransferase